MVVKGVILLLSCSEETIKEGDIKGIIGKLSNTESFVSEEFGIVVHESFGHNDPLVDEVGD